MEWPRVFRRPNRVAAVDSPPLAETRKIGPPGLFENRIVPSLFHAPPKGAGRGTPASSPIRRDVHALQLVSAKNPIERLSGDQNGHDPRSVPANGRANGESSDRSHN